MAKFAGDTWFELETCCNCHVQFAMTSDFMAARRKDRQSFYCPAGHGQHYTGASEESKLRKQLEDTNYRLAQAESKAAIEKAEREQVQKSHRKMRSRIMNGVCPCCNRTFNNLMQHMKSEHPDFGDITVKTLRVAFAMTQKEIAKETGIGTAYVSLYERGKPIPQWAKSRLDDWAEQHKSKHTQQSADK